MATHDIVVIGASAGGVEAISTIVSDLPRDLRAAVALKPELSIAYSHTLANGLLGMGFDVSGLSSIRRCPKTIAQDGAAGRVMLDLADVFCLDGNRLRLESGTYGVAARSIGPNSRPMRASWPMAAPATGPVSSPAADDR